MKKHTTLFLLLIIQHCYPLNSVLQAELLEMMEVDQAAREEYVRTRAASLWVDIEQIDLKHQRRMESIIDQYGWPNKDLVGSEGVSAAWLLVQHMELPFQKKCIILLKQAVDLGQAEPKQYAYLLDRVRLNEGQKQIYGTQLDVNFELSPVENLEALDFLRRSVGLMPIKEYVELCKALYTPSTDK